MKTFVAILAVLLSVACGVQPAADEPSDTETHLALSVVAKHSGLPVDRLEQFRIVYTAEDSRLLGFTVQVHFEPGMEIWQSDLVALLMETTATSANDRDIHTANDELMIKIQTTCALFTHEGRCVTYPEL